MRLNLFMSRRCMVKSRQITPDLLFNSTLVAKFINLLMLNGKKTVAEYILYKALELLESKFKKDKLVLLKTIIKNVKPIIEVRSRRVGGATYQIPVEVKPIRGTTLAIKWIISAARNRENKAMFICLANEFIDILENKGLAIKKKNDIHRMAEANKAFAHYRW